MILLLSVAAYAQDNPYTTALEQARVAILAGDWKAAEAALDDADDAAPDSPAVLVSADITRLEFYRGAVAWNSGDRDGALPLWRKAITLNTKFLPLPDVLPDLEGQDAYYALVSEVTSYPSMPLAVPDDTTAVIFVDGIRPEVDQEVPEGRHFIQIRCEDASLQGAWYTYGPPPPDYLALCRGESYPVPRRSPERVARAPRATRPGLAGDIAGWSLLTVGAGLIGTGAWWNFSVLNPLWNEGVVANETPGSVTQAEADTLVSDFNRNRAIVLGLVGVGVVAATPGVLLGPVDLSLSASPTSIGVTGQF